MNRETMVRRAAGGTHDILIIGGGATGAGIALDAASRGYSVLLLERHDFGKGTSSRSTKLVHGGVRYLGQGNVKLVTEALHERERLLKNAPHVVRVQPFIVPVYRWWEAPYYGAGLKAYDLLAGRHGFGHSRYLPRREVLRQLPNIEPKDLRGGILYYDGQFDDARLLIDILSTAADHGAAVLNYAPVTRIHPDHQSVTFRDEETGANHEATAKVIINATGVFCDSVRAMAAPEAKPMVSPSQGIHLVFDRSFLPGSHALMVPKTPDGRVMFAIPWMGHTLVGTTDVAVKEAAMEPMPTEAEIAFILETAGRYLARKPTRADVKSTFAGIRPLVKASGTSTAKLSRDHTLREENGLITITGGKWTTYRNMAEDCVNLAASKAGLRARKCLTPTLPIRDSQLGMTGSPESATVFAAEHLMARTVEDVMARRLRTLFLDSQEAVSIAPQVVQVLAKELGKDHDWQQVQLRQFRELAKQYSITEPTL